MDYWGGYRNMYQSQSIGGPEREVRRASGLRHVALHRQYPDNVILKGPEDTNKVALTFDDGPDIRYTPQILDILAYYQVPATFFLLAARAVEHAAITQRIHNEGHAIGSHTYWHPVLTEEDIERVRWEVISAEEGIESVVGFRPRMFRAPYGALTAEIVEELQAMNNTVVGWSVDSLDWQQLPPDVIATNVLNNTSVD